MEKKDYQEFIELSQNMYADRDSYSRGKIIEDLRNKVTEIYNNSKSQPSPKEEEKYQYKFTYKCSKGLMGVKLIDTKIKDNEEAIAKFENKYPDLVWRQIELISPPKN